MTRYQAMNADRRERRTAMLASANLGATPAQIADAYGLSLNYTRHELSMARHMVSRPAVLARICREAWAEGYRRQEYTETVIARARKVYGDRTDWPTLVEHIRCVAIDRGEG